MSLTVTAMLNSPAVTLTLTLTIGMKAPIVISAAGDTWT